MIYDLRGDFGIDPDDLYDRFAFYFEAFPQITRELRLTVSGIYRQRPGADAIVPSNGEPAIDLGDGIWLSPGLSNSYLLATDEGRVVVNTGMGFEGPLHRRAYGAVDATPTRRSCSPRATTTTWAGPRPCATPTPS